MLEGEISEINLVERLVELWREQFTGAIRFESDGIIKIVYFKGGDILSASTNDRADSVDEILMRAGKVSREHVKQALAKRKENETLGDALLNLGFITRKELTWGRRVQVVGVIRSIAAWETGSFTIVADYLPKRDEGTLFPVPQVLTELIVTDQDRQKFERATDGGSAVFAKSADFDDVFRKLGLNEQAETIVKQIDGTKSVSEVATAAGGDSFNVYKLLCAMATLRVLNRVDATPAQPEFALDDFAAAGVADAADVWNEPQPEPQFDLDETVTLGQPTIEIQTPPVPSSSAWDEEEQQEEAPAPIMAAPTPAPAPIPMPVTATVAAEEEQWGFDEAQIEAARRATVASTPKPGAQPMRAKPKKSRRGLWIALIAIVLLAGAGYAGFRWWQGRQEVERQALSLPSPRRAKSPPLHRDVPAVPATIVDIAPTTTTTTGTTETIAVTTTTPPPPATATAALAAVTPKPAPVAAATTPTPPPVNDARAKYDAMAREFAANPAGNFTVQVQILCEPSNLTKAMSSGGTNVWFVPQQIGSRPCYRVFWGRYNTRDEAQRALAAIPADVRDPSAAVKPIPKG
jgi:hypothetical protein